MLEFAWIWAILLLPLPLVIYYLLPAVETKMQSMLKVPFLDDFQQISKQSNIVISNSLLILPISAWIFLVSASMRPQWIDEPVELAISGRDIMLAVDLSGSMAQHDFSINGQQVNRLTAVKIVAQDFIKHRTGDRLGLILFGTNAYLQTPLTFDRMTVMTLLNESFLRLAGESTAIGDAIGLAVKRLKNKSDKTRVLILLTDGANTAGTVTPLKAAELAASYNLKIYTIGIGSERMVTNGFFGKEVFNPSKDLDEKTLISIADITKGKYFRAKNTNDLIKIYQLLDKLEPIEKDKRYFYPKSELYYYPLAISLLLAFVISIMRLKRT